MKLQNITKSQTPAYPTFDEYCMGRRSFLRQALNAGMLLGSTLLLPGCSGCQDDAGDSGGVSTGGEPPPVKPPKPKPPESSPPTVNGGMRAPQPQPESQRLPGEMMVPKQPEPPAPNAGSVTNTEQPTKLGGKPVAPVSPQPTVHVKGKMKAPVVPKQEVRLLGDIAVPAPPAEH